MLTETWGICLQVHSLISEHLHEHLLHHHHPPRNPVCKTSWSAWCTVTDQAGTEWTFAWKNSYCPTLMIGTVTPHGATESRDTSPSYSLSPGRHISWPQVHTASTGIERGTGTVRIPHYLTKALKQFKITPVKEKQHFSLISQFRSLQGIVLLNCTGSVLMRTTEGLTQLCPKSA